MDLCYDMLSCVQRNIRSFQQLVSMKEEERRALLRQLTDSEYRDVMNVVATLPNVEVKVRCEGEFNAKITFDAKQVTCEDKSHLNASLSSVKVNSYAKVNSDARIG